MQIGITKRLNSLEEFTKHYPGVDHESIWKVALFLEERYANSLRDQFIFLFPDIKNISEQLSISPRELIDALVFLSTTCNDLIYPAEVFENPRNGELYLLNQFEKEDLRQDDIIYDREHPESFQFTKAAEKIRNAFIIKIAKTVC